MQIGGNPQDVRVQASRVRTWAAELDRTAADVRSGYGVRWVGVAAERHRDRLHEHAGGVADARAELGDLARALDRLADELEERQAAIRRAADAVQDTLDGARRTLGRLADVGRDLWTAGERDAEAAARRVLDTVQELPPPGSPRWLDLARELGR